MIAVVRCYKHITPVIVTVFEKNDEQHVKEELADVIIYCRDLLDRMHLDVDEIVNMKMDMNEKKYPVEKACGNAKKYTEL